MLKKILIICAIDLVGLSVCYAEKVLPVSTGEWYDDFPVFVNIDSCSRFAWSYSNKSSIKESIVDAAFANLPPHSECTWSKPKFNDYFTPPLDFPALSIDMSDYKAVVAQGGPQSEIWEADCNGKYGTDYIESREIYPLYQCPSNSRVTEDDSTNPPTIICSTTPGICTADVVGRDLDSFGLGMLGHVGLATSEDFQIYATGNNVLEVLNNENVININSLASFEHPSSGSYWGEVYGLPNLNYIDQTKAITAVDSGYEQVKFAPQYTLTTFWQEGGYQKTVLINPNNQESIVQFAIKPAIFRCDTFVNYCYMKGFNVTIPTSPNIFPVTTYYSFINQRTDVPPQISDLSDMVDKDLSTALNKNNYLEIDNLVRTYMNNPSLSQKDKMTALWKAGQKYQNSPAQYGYLIDSLSMGQNPYFIIPEYIKVYSQQSSLENKRKLILRIGESSRISFKDFQNITPERKEYVIQAQNFLINILQTETEPTLLNQALVASAMILPATLENYRMIEGAIDRFTELAGNEISTKQKFYILTLSKVLATPELQNSQLPVLLSASKNSEENKIFNSDLFVLLKQMSTDDLSVEAKKLLKQYLVEQNNQNGYLDVVYPFTKKNDINMLYALAKINSTSEDAEKQYIVNYLLNSKGIQRAWLVSQVENNYVSLMRATDFKLLQKSLQSEMKNMKDVRGRLIYAKALTRLNDVAKEYVSG